jgi:hypothetical protein
MNVEELSDTIEGHEFAAELNASSDWNTFQWAMHHHPAVRTLNSLLGSTTGKESILRRVGSLSNREVDPRYENVSDVALTVYVSLLAGHDATLGRLAAGAAARASRCWWTTRVANRLLSLGPSSPAVGDTFAITGSAPIVRSPHLEVADTLIWPDVLHDDPVSHLLSNPSIRSSKGQDSATNRIALGKSPWASLRTEAGASETSN